MNSLAPKALDPVTVEFRHDVWKGLAQPVKQIPAKYLYDAQGSRLFDAITELDEYYPTRTELGILSQHGAEMIEALGRQALLVEYGSGSSLKTRVLLDHGRDHLAGYVPVDISGEHLRGTAKRLRERYPHFEIRPVVADFTRAFRLPEIAATVDRVVAFFPGSTIGNFTEKEAIGCLQAIAKTVGHRGGLLIGVDLVKPADVLRRAYNDVRGVTAAFNKNVLTRINRELDGNFVLDRFVHQAPWLPEASRIEMHLVSRLKQMAMVAGRPFALDRDEIIVTEHSHKYSLDQFARLAAQGGWRVEHAWTDPREWFSVQYLVSNQ